MDIQDDKPRYPGEKVEDSGSNAGGFSPLSSDEAPTKEMKGSIEYVPTLEEAPDADSTRRALLQMCGSD